MNRQRLHTFMNQDRTRRYLDVALLGAILLSALFLRSNLTYRTAFVDEAISLSCGWRILNEGSTEASSMRMGWPILSCTPFGIMGEIGGLVWARGFNAVCGILTILFTMLMTRRLFGRLAGYLAGGIFAVSGVAIFLSTFAHSDSLSLLLISAGFWAWTVAYTKEKALFYALGSLSLTASILVKYSSVVPVFTASILGILLCAYWGINKLQDDKAGWTLYIKRRYATALVFGSLPFLLLFLFAFLYRDSLSSVWNSQVLSKSSSHSEVFRQIITEYLTYAWLPLLLSLPMLLFRKRRVISFGLFLVGISLLGYHLLNRDQSTVFKFTVYGLITLVPLAAAGLTMAVRKLTYRADARLFLPAWIVLATGIVLYHGWVGQTQLPGLRSYWSDTSEVIAFLRERVGSEDVLLFEGGQVAHYYLVIEGQPERRPKQVITTWWYHDDQGAGLDAFRRGIVEQRFDWIVLDHWYKPDINPDLLQAMDGHYQMAASFPARRFGSEGVVEVFAPLLQTDLPPIDTSLHAQFDVPPLIELHGYNLTASRLERGETLELTLFWQAIERPSENYRVFVHLADTSERIVAQQDTVPVYGSRLTTSWRPGEVIVDTHIVPIPLDVEPGTYQLWIGLYCPDTLRRLPASVNDMRSPDDRILIEPIVISP